MSETDKPRPKLILKPKPKTKRLAPKLKINPIKSRPIAHIETGQEPESDSDDEDLLSFPLHDLRNDAGLLTDQHANQPIIDMLSKLTDVAKAQRACASGKEKANHGRRISSFIKALDAIKSFPEQITSGSQAQRDVEGVGKGIAKRIDEFLKTGTLEEIEQATDPHAKVIMELCSVTGIGEVKAEHLATEHGVTSVPDLVAKYKAGLIKIAKNQLTHHIVVGLDYYYDLEQRMPWSEADQIAQIIVQQVKLLNPKYIINVCGSYRRHKPTCGDLDVLIAHPEIIEDRQLNDDLPEIVQQLESCGLLVGHLTTKGKTKYMGVCKLDTPNATGRRIDIRFVTYPSLGAATLYFTGSGKFNKIMRFRANQRHFTLNEYGLYSYVNGVKGAKIPAPTERDIFQKLNFVYLEPEQREF